ncbi:polysaccharide lyase 6 family protein [Paenibacillus sp. H1-7]|uniref:polysaccharide lyase 6 family protein n=1 Tax=Paenibacillus sp. H1-7 TaxID=2282849 RepID=UPI001EF9AFE1|nr:polysaccharide lyase 6 family protein [Paenibacillus sp. H1-7]
MRKKVFRVLQCVCVGTMLLPAGMAAASESTAPVQTAALVSASSDASVQQDNVVRVTTTAELTAAISAAAAGTTIVLADGVYSHTGAFSISGKNGTASAPITIKAENQGQAELTARAGFNISNSSYIVIQGFKFTGTAIAVNMNNSNNIRVTRNTFAMAVVNNPAGWKWVQFGGNNSHHNRIDHNEFGPRGDLGQMIAFQNGVMSQYDVIEYNYFHDAAPQTTNGGETIRVGLSGSSMSNGYTTIQYNLFVNLDSDPEVISVKSGNNTVRYNTFINNKGQVTARHGHANSYYGNYFFRVDGKSGVGGLRIYANDQKIYNNYFENISGAIHIDGGDYDAGPDGSNYDSSVLAKHWRVYRAQVTNNTMVNASNGIVVGKSYTYAPVDSVVANNLVVGSGGPLYSEVKTSNTFFEGNIGYGGTLDNVTRATYEIREADPLFVTLGGLQKLSAGSPAINTGTGSYPFLNEDMDGQPRDAIDVGADEYSAAPALRQPLTPADVGPNAVTAIKPQAAGKDIAEWYNGSVNVALSAMNTEPGTRSIEYRLNGQQAWASYTGPLSITQEGKHTIAYRYTNEEGLTEPEGSVQIQIDKTKPTYQLTLNGKPYASSLSFADTDTLNVQLQAQDGLSGLAKQSFTILEATYETQATIPLTARIGQQSINVEIADKAGNVTAQTLSFRVTPTLASLSGLVEGYAASGELTGSLVPQLTNSLKQAQHHYEKGSIEQAIQFVDDNFLKHLNNKDDQITAAAKQVLQNYAQALVAFWSK